MQFLPTGPTYLGDAFAELAALDALDPVGESLRASLEAEARVMFARTRACSEWRSSTASREAIAFLAPRRKLSYSNPASASCNGTCPPHRSLLRSAFATAMPSRSAWLAPCPLKGLIGCEASPSKVTRLPNGT